MTEPTKPRRGRGEGSLHWSESRQRWIAEVTVGYSPAGKRITRKGSGRTKTEARAKLREQIRDYEDGLTTANHQYTVADAVEDFLKYAYGNRAQKTKEKAESLCRVHIVPHLGARKLRDLSAQDVDRFLTAKARSLSTATVGNLHSLLNRAVKRAMKREFVKRNVVELCQIPRGRRGRPSKALDLVQAKAVMAASEQHAIHAYVVLSLLIGARTEELRALRWDHVDLDGRPDADPPRPPSAQLWRSVREGGDTKTKKSRRSLALPGRCVTALTALKLRQDADRDKAGKAWQETGLVFTTTRGTALDAANVRRSFRWVLKRAGLDEAAWTPREMRHSFVSLMSDSGVSLEDIADLCGHASTKVTETVYRHQLRPVLLQGADAMDAIFGAEDA